MSYHTPRELQQALSAQFDLQPGVLEYVLMHHVPGWFDESSTCIRAYGYQKETGEYVLSNAAIFAGMWLPLGTSIYDVGPNVFSGALCDYKWQEDQHPKAPIFTADGTFDPPPPHVVLLLARSLWLRQLPCTRRSRASAGGLRLRLHVTRSR